MPSLNMHQFKVINDGKHALYISRRALPVALEGYEDMFGIGTGLLADLGIYEIELGTDKVLLE